MPFSGIPPWIQPADEAGQLSKGIALGAQIGEAQARQRMQEQQQLREQEQMAQDKARWEAEFNMASQAQARKLQAQAQYQTAIRANQDPLKALLEFGPAMGQQGSAEAAAIRASAMQAKPQVSWSPVDLPEGLKGMQSNTGQLRVLPRAQPQANVPTGPVQGLPVLGPDGQPAPGLMAFPSATGKGVTIHRMQDEGRLTQVDRDELHDLEREQDRLQKLIDKDEDPLSPTGMFATKPPAQLTPPQRALLTAAKARKEQLQKLQDQIDAIRTKHRPSSEAPAGGSSGDSPRVRRAKQLAAQHPDWTKEQVIAAVKKEIAANATTSD